MRILFVLFGILCLQQIMGQGLDTSKIAVLPLHPCLSYLSGQYPHYARLRQAYLVEGDVERIEKIVVDFIKTHNAEDPSDFTYHNIDLEQYKRQYIVFFSRRGQKEVFINFVELPEGHEARWKTGFVLIADGGKACFRLTINLTTGRIHDFSTNGIG